MIKKNTLIIIIILLISSSIILDFVLAEDLKEDIELKEGKNYLQLNQSIYVKELIFKNPEIEFVSYYDNSYDRNIAYVNVFGGIGDDFVILPSLTYEISVNKDIILKT